MVEDNNGIQRILDRINSSFINILKKASELDVTRTLQISTYFLNLNIAENYFPYMNSILKSLHKVGESDIPENKMARITKNLERIYDICIWYPLKYKCNSEISKYKTDVQIDAFENEVNIIWKFFWYNNLPKDSNMDEITNTLENSTIMVNLLPNLEFDPEFMKIRDHEAFQHMFNTFPSVIFSDSYKYNEMKYKLDENLLNEYREICYDENRYENFLFKMNPDLLMSKHIIQLFNYGYVINLGCKQMLDEIASLFIQYYSKRIPSRAFDIKNNIYCFIELLKLTQGKLYQELKWNDIVKHFENQTNKEFGEIFLEQICLEYLGEDFDLEYSNFDETKFLNDHHAYLKKACNYHFGIVRTGAFMVWRSMLKFFEELHKEPEFYKIKGVLLENWCFTKASESGLNPEKIILTNQNKEPTETYYLMKEQVKDWPREIMEINLPFPEEYAGYYFQEIDLVMRVQDTLFVIECKGTSAPIGEQGKYIKWITNFNDNFEHLKQKCKLLKSLIDNNLIENNYLKGVRNYIPLQIQTEGIFFKNLALSDKEYPKLLDELKIHKQSKSIKIFLHQFQGNIL